MAKNIKIKECAECNAKIYNVDIATKYCENCRKEINRKQKIARPLKEYEINIHNIADEPYKLTPKYFNKHSPISVRAYSNCFRISWLDVLKKYNRYEEFYSYILEEFSLFIKNTGRKGFNSFEKSHSYITADLMKKIGSRQIREDVGIDTWRWSDEDLKENFHSIKNKLNRIPLYHEFVSMSKIRITVYTKRLCLKGTVYDEIVKYYSTENEYDEYIANKKIHKSEVGKETGALSATHTDDDYEKEFRRVFDYCLEKYKTLPSRRLFCELSKFDNRSYTKKYKMSWLDVCEMYGYEVERTSNRSEKIALVTVQNIIKEDFIPQKTFDWLLGIHGYPLFCDGYYPKNRLIVEFDGVQHRESVEAFGGEKTFSKLKQNDNIKNTLIPINGLRLLRISSDEPFWNENYIREKLIKSNII